MEGRPNTREEALRSALGRLPLSLFLVDGSKLLRPLNGKAAEMLEREGIRGDIITARPSHPLSRLVQEILDAPPDREFKRVEMRFPSGRTFFIEPSRRSEKGMERWLVLLADAAHPQPLDRIDQWALTERERDVARLLTEGKSSEEICEMLDIAQSTLKTHVKRLLEKTGARHRAELVAKFAGTAAPDGGSR